MVCSKRSTAFALPRGYGKSTYAWELMATWNILHRGYRYIMYIGSTVKIAEQMFANLKASVMGHPIVSSCMTDIHATNNTFTYTIAGVRYRMACYGSGQQLRGQRFEEVRPDLIIADDLETTEATRSDEQRKKMKDWFFADVIPLDINARYFIIGTYLHEDCLLANLINSPPEEASTQMKWNTFRYGVADYDSGKPTWPEKYDDAWIDTERKKYIQNGMLYRFNTEYMNIAVDRKDRAFNPEQIRFCSPEQYKAMRNGRVDIITVVDPGIHASSDHDPTVILTTAMDSLDQIWILNIIRKNMVHHEILEEIAAEYRKWNPRRLLIESVQAQEYLLQDLENGTWPGGLVLPVERIDHKQVRMGKLRIYGLENLFHGRKLIVPASAPWWPELCTEMITFPRGKHDDILDSLAYAKLNHTPVTGYKMDLERFMRQQSHTSF
jgi:predicted phage terminase large subunit-like protein